MHKTIFHVFLVFFLIFSFRIPFFYNSAILAFIISIPFCVLRSDFYTQTLKSDLLVLLLLFFLIVLTTLLVVILHSTYDFDKLNALASQFVVIFACLPPAYAIARTSKNKKNKLLYISKIISISFYLQSFIVILSLLSYDFWSIIKIFQASDQADIYEKYQGVRGLSLAGGQFFSLSAVFVLGQLFIAYYLLNKSKVSYFDIILFIIVFFCGLTAGRTSALGGVIAISYWLLSWRNHNSKVIFTKLFVVSMLSALLIVPLLKVLGKYDFVIDVFIPFAFEFLVNYLEGDGLSTSSSNVLFSMYHGLSLDVILLGLGRYIGADGAPFMHSDPGYMRNMYLYGLFFSMPIFLFFFFNVNIFLKFYRDNIDKKFLYFFVGCFLLLHVKGEVISHLITTQSLLFVVVFYGMYSIRFGFYNER
ncbi:hypothetical protein [Vibrio hepatarius]|uniref:hypothetical protein n=1 Tax=Vibrio hepatarius TaxID=171383 RepID=UPI001C0A5F89|nr:hypothetical protein [Vibrio hepatarius]MBU2896911.1 hypothetical protein [Vibrio hepatarius]